MASFLAMTIISSIALSTYLTTVSGQVNPVPAIGWVGSSIHLLYGLDPFGSIVDHTYSGEKTSDGNFDISDSVVDVPNVQCSYSSQSFTVDTYDEYKYESTSNFKISGSYKEFSGAYSQTRETIKNKIYKEKKIVSRLSADCIQYELNLIQNDAILEDWFIDDAKLLPSSIDNDDDLADYFSFFDYYGTHIVTGCQVGGSMKQYSFTHESYAESHSTSKITQEAEATFFVSIDGSNSESTAIDSTYAASTTTWNIETVGGEWPDTLDNWVPWIQSIQNLENVACINWSAQDITDVWDWNEDLIERKSIAEEALALYFNRTGCTIPNAVNYDRYALEENDDSICEYKVIPEFRICFQEIEGSSQCGGTRSSCSDWSSTASFEDIATWTSPFRDDTDKRSGGCKYQWKLEQRDSSLTYKDSFSHRYRICFKESEGSSQCQGTRSSCSGWNSDDIESWTTTFRDDTNNRSGGCKYQWVIEQEEDEYSDEIDECRICFQETEGSSQCQGSRNTCTGWSKTAPAWSAYFRDDTDNRSGGCKYSWKIQCR